LLIDKIDKRVDMVDVANFSDTQAETGLGCRQTGLWATNSQASSKAAAEFDLRQLAVPHLI
jgi:hypothetical protein